ncbi:hypothetical protein [Halocynthiibacter styelae]|uniref:Uncharacterized protein n=1 Tax=Halocynthiibacter styelae TaxID=2761955 RepID=A0A8J7IJC6_9RHOB|nr:hypothetical protein [Paenihalocynthiibacter styelae]MBI1494078.1 hypothetical protein [Paenihalocynthiibacter styelae]
MSEWFSQVVSGLALILTNPILLFLVILLIGGKWFILNRVTKRTQRKFQERSTSGWGTPAQRSLRTHDTGVGTLDIKVMKPSRRTLPGAFVGLLFFGGCAYLAWTSMIPEAQVQSARPDKLYKAWFVFVISGLFALGTPYIAWFSFHRIEVTRQDLVLRRPLCRRKIFLLSTLQSVTPIGPNGSNGVKLYFSDGRSLRLLASFDGYGEVLNSLTHLHPDLMVYKFLGNRARNAMKKRE